MQEPRPEDSVCWSVRGSDEHIAKISENSACLSCNWHKYTLREYIFCDFQFIVNCMFIIVWHVCKKSNDFIVNLFLIFQTVFLNKYGFRLL